MTIALTETAKYIAIPLIAPAVGAVIALRRHPSNQLKSLIRHVAAGLVFAAATVELLPGLFKDKQPLATFIGFVLGVGLLVVVNALLGGHYHGDKDETAQHHHTDASDSSLLSILISAVFIDVAVDGLLIGIGFATGKTEGQLLLLALSVEALFMGLVLTVACKQNKLAPIKSLLIATSPGVILAAMALVGATILSALHGAWHQAVLAFGISALLYLVTEELLVEAHKSPDEPLEVAGFFAGFLLILMLAIV